MARLTPQQYQDELIYRQTRVVRYTNGQVKLATNLVNELNKKLAEYCLRKELLESKKQYNDIKQFIKKQSIIYRDKLYKHLQKEMRGFVEEQAAWIYANSPVELDKKKVDTIMRHVFFEAFSESENIKTFVTRIFNQIFQLWNAQLTIAYRTKLPMKKMILNILGDES